MSPVDPTAARAIPPASGRARFRSDKGGVHNADKSGTLLKALLHERDWQNHDRFSREFIRVAADIGEDPVPPELRTLRRWKNQQMLEPRHYHRKVLEAMFPGYTTEELFTPFDRHSGKPIPPPRNSQARQDAQGPHPVPKPPTEFRNTTTPATPAGYETPDPATAEQERMRSLMSWVEVNSPIKEHDIDRTPTGLQAEQPPQVRRGMRIFTDDGLVQENFVVGDRVIKVHHSVPDSTVEEREIHTSATDHVQATDRRRSR